MDVVDLSLLDVVFMGACSLFGYLHCILYDINVKLSLLLLLPLVMVFEAEC
jgi:hypothetical protein